MSILFTRNNRRRLYRYFFSLVLFYANIVLSFALIYILLDVSGLGPVVDHHYTVEMGSEPWPDIVIKSLYFSVITLFSVGYGDVTPFGWSRMIAIIQAMIGYILPAVVVIQYMYLTEFPE